MTTAAETAKEAKDAATKARNAEMKAREKVLNEGKSGKGLRIFLGMTRGRNPQEIQYENWDDALPDSLPKSLSEVIDIHKSRGQDGDVAEKELVRRWVLGDNEVLYSEASDPIAEFVDPTWSDEVQKGFRAVVRNYAVNTDTSIEDAANLFKPAYVAAQAKASASASK